MSVAFDEVMVQSMACTADRVGFVSYHFVTWGVPLQVT